MLPHWAAGNRFEITALQVLTFSTGVADAVGYLALDKVFTGNMTGNVVILGMGVAGADDLPVVGALIALLAFVVGAAIGGRALRGAPTGWTPRCTALLVPVALAFAAAAVMLAVVPVTVGTVEAFSITAVLAAAMGLQAAVARKIGIRDLTTVVVTSTLAGLAADSRLAGRVDQPWLRRAGAVGLIATGALVGALLIGLQVWAGVAVPAILTALVAAAAWHVLRVRAAHEGSVVATR
ncbi:YoaK family protein [Pseudonocardia thermophila]|uniref:YoaK family protein n=1 Tax=Pseudonocardia thermophila TaxID=1848 RepID=UPI00248D6D35|nr:YoaK family protein [Pseudonocardia thermophila]